MRPGGDRRTADLLTERLYVRDPAAADERPTLVQGERDDRQADGRGGAEQRERDRPGALQEAISEDARSQPLKSALVLHQYVSRPYRSSS